MLHLTRKLGQSIMINNNIEMVVKEIGRNRVSLGFKCNTDSVILRKELYDKLAQTNQSALKSLDSSILFEVKFGKYE